MLAMQIAREESELTVVAIRPGVVDTEMQRELRDVHSKVMEDMDNSKFFKAHQENTLLRPEMPGHVMAEMVLRPPKALSGKFLR